MHETTRVLCYICIEIYVMICNVGGQLAAVAAAFRINFCVGDGKFNYPIIQSVYTIIIIITIFMQCMQSEIDLQCQYGCVVY